MRVLLGTTTPGQKGQTRGSVSACDADVREEDRESVKCFFTDLWRLNGDRPRGAPSKYYLVRVEARDLLVASYVASYDVSSNRKDSWSQRVTHRSWIWRSGASNREYCYLKSRLHGCHNTGTLTTSSHRGSDMNTLSWYRWCRRC